MWVWRRYLFGKPGNAPRFRWRDHLYSALAVAVATALAVPLELLVSNADLMLLYVLAVIVVGLTFGSLPAMTTSFLAFLSFNFFLTQPRYTFHVVRDEEVATLIFLLIIALICGPVASLVRDQFLLLKEANRHSEALRRLGQSLSVADDLPAVSRALSEAVTESLHRSCVVQVREQPQTGGAPSLTEENWASLDTGQRESGGVGPLEAGGWLGYPLITDHHVVAMAWVENDSGDHHGTGARDRRLMESMAQQAANTWRRITLMKALEAERLRAEMETLRAALLSSVSHDLKSPLSAMMGAAESLSVLDHQLQPEDRRELADAILTESRRLDSYIQNLLDMTRLGAGRLELERDWVSISDIVGAALSHVHRYFPGTRIEYAEPDELPLIFANEALIEQALFNILENAVKFSPPEASIRVTVTAERACCRIAVEDRGPGVPPELREAIFDMFYVVSGGDQKRQNTGMGLAICRGMVNAHGGTVEAGPGTDGTGTRFVVTLPVGAAAPKVQGRSGEKYEGEQSERRT